MMLVPLVDANGEENGTLRRLVDRMGEVYSTG
jgi:protein BCP1